MTPEQEKLLHRYSEEVINSPLHLTADRDLRQFWVRHVQDALELNAMISAEIKNGPARVLDVGSGNGIPGIPIAIMNPSWNVELLDSDNKKCGFLDMFCKKHAIKNCHIIVGRAEIIGKTERRQSYDIVFARAVGKLPVALELAGSFVKIGGRLIVPHGTSWESELKDSKTALEIIGLKLYNYMKYQLDGIDFFALFFSKINDTPALYPRSIGIPEKRPL